MIIYKITNIQNNKVYIGQTKRKLSMRMYRHFQDAKDGCNYALHRAIRKYGKENFKYKILGYCSSQEELNEAEKVCIWFFQSNNTIYGYNLTEGGEGGAGSFRSEEQRQKTSKKLKGRIPWNKGKTGVYTEEHLKYLSEVQKKSSPHRKGWHHSEETRLKISKNEKGKIVTVETCKNISESLTGRTL